MNACRICGLKGLNCDCTDSDRKAYELEEEMEEAEEKIQHLKKHIEQLEAQIHKQKEAEIKFLKQIKEFHQGFSVKNEGQI